MLAAHIQLDGIVTLVDAKHIIAQLDKRTWLSKMNSLFLPSLSFFSLLTWTCSDAKLNIEWSGGTNCSRWSHPHQQNWPGRWQGSKKRFSKFPTISTEKQIQTLAQVKSRLQGVNPTAEVVCTQYSKVGYRGFVFLFARFELIFHIFRLISQPFWMWRPSHSSESNAATLVRESFKQVLFRSTHEYDQQCRILEDASWAKARCRDRLGIVACSGSCATRQIWGVAAKHSRGPRSTALQRSGECERGQQ